MSRQFKILDNLSKIAEDIEPVNTFRVAAAITYKKELISYGFCANKSHPFQKKYSKNDEAIFIHAENSAIVNALRKIDVKDFQKATLYVARVKKPFPNCNSYIWGLARPCSGCMKAIAAFGIKNVYYTCDGDYNGRSSVKRFDCL